MQALTTKYIDNLIDELSNEGHTYQIDRSGIAYIRHFLKPYAGILEDATSVEQIVQWLPLVFSHNVLNHVNVSDGYDLNSIKKLVIRDIIAYIFEISEAVEEDSAILPWDIREALLPDEFMCRAFGIDLTNDKLPVIVILDHNEHYHEMTMEFALALLLFSAPKGNLEIRMFGAPLSMGFLMVSSGRFNKHHYPHVYSVVIYNNTYWFKTPDFMQGFKTGADWQGVDHHAYWKDLIHYTPTGQAVQITF